MQIMTASQHSVVNKKLGLNSLLIFKCMIWIRFPTTDPDSEG